MTLNGKGVVGPLRFSKFPLCDHGVHAKIVQTPLLRRDKWLISNPIYPLSFIATKLWKIFVGVKIWTSMRGIFGWLSIWRVKDMVAWPQSFRQSWPRMKHGTGLTMRSNRSLKTLPILRMKFRNVVCLYYIMYTINACRRRFFLLNGGYFEFFPSNDW